MATTTQTGKPSDSTPLYALVGATDLAVEGVRHVLADAARRRAEVRAGVQTQVEHLQAEIGKRRAEVTGLLGEPRRLQAGLEQVPGLVLGRALEVAAKAETQYEGLAERGKSLLERLSSQPATEDQATIENLATAEDRATTEDRAPQDGAAVRHAKATVIPARKRATRTRTATKRTTTSTRTTTAAAAKPAGPGAEKVSD